MKPTRRIPNAWVWSNFAPTNLKGRMYLALSQANAGTLYSYDPVGRVTDTWQCTPSGCGNAADDKHLAYTYDWAGNLTSQSDPAAGNITYGRSPAGELTSVTNNTYTLSGASGTATLLSNAQNGPNGPISYNFGNGLSQYNNYDSLGRINGGWVCIGAPSAACPNQRNGFALSWSGSRVSGYTEDYLGRTTGDIGTFTPTYDDFNRLSALTQKTTGAYASTWQQTFSYTYDRYGNRWAQNAPQGGPSFSQSFNAANNQLNSSSGYTYDAAGNMTYDGFHHYSYDADGNIVSVDSGSTAKFVFDALNHRVSSTFSAGYTEALFDTAGRITSTWSGPNTSSESHIFADGQQIAFRSGDSHTYFIHKDWLGTDRVHTDLNGNTAAIFTSYPWGDGGAATVSETYGGWDFSGFGDLDDDSWDNTYHAQFRNYSQAQGRWLSPDPYDGSYDQSNPQSFNRYVYVLNNPLMGTDPSGLQCDLWTGCGDGDCANDPNCSSGGAGGGGGGCQVWDASCGGGGLGGSPFSKLGSIGLQAENGWYYQLVNCGFNPGSCDPSQDLPGETIYVNCGGADLFDLTCLPDAASMGYLASGNHPYYSNPISALANQVNGEAGFIGTPGGVAAFYGASVAEASILAIPTMDVAVGSLDGGIHFAYGVDGDWFQLLGRGGLGYQTSAYAAKFAEESFTFPLPVLNPEAVLPEFGQGAANCFTAVCGGVLRGWWPF